MPFIERNGVNIYYEAHGSAQRPAIVFAHGAGGNAAIWFNQIAHFAADFRCIVFDHRGFARSPTDAESVSVEQFRDDLLAIMDTLDVQQAHLVGQSMGGFTILRTALDAPQRVASLTFSCTSGGIYNPAPTQAVKNLTADTGNESDNDASGVAATMSGKTQGDPALMQLYASINNFNTQFSWSRLRHLLGKDGVVQHEQLKAIHCPTLFISGEEDPLFPPQQLAAMVPHFPSARIEIVKDAGHSPYFETPEVFNQLLRDHLSGSS